MAILRIVSVIIEKSNSINSKSNHAKSLKHSSYTVYAPYQPPLLIAIVTINFRYVEIGAVTTEILI